MKRNEAVRQGAPLVHDLEEAAMSQVRATAAATLGFIDLRRSANLSAQVGAEAWGELAAITAAAHEGLRCSLAFHRKMAEVQTHMGCGRVRLNGGGEKPDHDAFTAPFDPGTAEATPLRIVA